ncbi:DUF6046 domain-containing protein [Flavobacterium cerinum]|uniref:DUF6046 domain-containing protein n=1 Tax=Flavobacterium cerinum TaxID=2502784 RepID=A0A3S3QDK2_9FLAO|nr:DUF6046 domain-containing protein [Flavobacterium cerinum]RWX00912.1 hypothetical protein EPI11_07780 [Flavobacterium cerinum]
MAFNENDLLFAALVGNGLVKTIPRLSIIQNELQKHVLPVLPFIPFKNTVNVAKVESDLSDNLGRADAPTPAEKQFFPLSFSIDEGNTWFLLPYETMISISGKNTLIRRNVAKWKEIPGIQPRKGSVKERWNEGDYEITITGVLIGSLIHGNFEDCFPKADFEKLRQVLTHAQVVMVSSPPLELLGIQRIAIEDFNFPFTKGENVQAYDIKAYSDFSYNLILT